MADIGRIYDSMGRLIGEAEDIKGVLRSMLERDVGKPKSYNAKSEPKAGAQEELKKQVDRLEKILKETNDNAKDYAESIINASKTIEDAIKSKSKSPDFVDPSKIYEAISSGFKNCCTEEKTKAEVSQDKLLFADGGEDKTFKSMDKSLTAIEKNLRKGGGGGSGGGGSGGSGGLDFDFDSGSDDGKRYGDEFAKAAGKSIRNGISVSLGNLSPVQQIFGAAIDDEMEYQRNMKKIAFQTQGLTMDTADLQSQFFQTGKVVEKTGFNLSAFQQAYTENIKKGLKPQKESLNITTSALNTSKMLGLESGALGGTFADWNMHLGLSDTQLADVGRGMRDVALFSGVTGENLEQAVKSSEGFMKNMKSAGTLTASAAKNIMTMSTFAQKLGVADEMKGLMDGMTSSSNLLLNASQQTKNMLYMAAGSVGRISDLQQGTIMNTKAGIKDMAKGMENTFSRITGFSSDQIDQMTAEQKMKVNVQLESALGVGLEDFSRQIEVMKESGKSYTERLATIDKQLEANLTLEEENRLKLQKKNMALSAGLEMSTKLADAAKGVDTVSEAVSKIRKNAGAAGFGDIQRDLADMSKNMGMEDLASKVSSGDNQAIAQAMALSATSKLADAGGTDYSSEMLDAIKSNDMSEIRELQAKMTEEQQKMGISQEASTDPTSQAAQTLSELNETVRSFTGPALHLLTGILGAIGMIPIMIGAGILSAFLGAGGIVASIVGSLGPMLLAGGGAAGAATAVGGAATAIGGGLATAAAAVGPALSAAAAALPAIGIGIAALAAAVLLIGAAINYTIGTEELEKITGAAIALIKGVAVFAWEMLKIGASITALGLLASLSGAMGPLMLMGAAALAVLIPGVLALGAAMMALGAAIEYVVGADESVKLIGNVAAFIDAASGVVWSIVKLSALTTILGALLAFVPGVLISMAAGALALIILTPSILGFGTAMMALGAGLEYVVGTDESVKLIGNISSFIDAATGVAWSLTKFSVVSAILGVAAVLATVGAVGLLLGAAALAVLTVPILSFAAAILSLDAILSYVTGLDLTSTMEKISGIVDAATGVAWSLTKLSVVSSLLLPAAALAIVGAVGLLAGAAALGILSPGIAAFALATVALDALLSFATGRDLTSTMELTSGVVDAATGVAWSLIKLSVVSALLLPAAALAIVGAVGLLAGAVALGIITPPILAFTGAIFVLGATLDAIAGLDYIISVTEKMSALVNATMGFAWAIIKFSAVATALGAMAIFAPILGIALAAGAAALWAMMKGFMAFSTVTVLFGKSFDAIGGIDEAVNITEKLGEFVGAIQSFVFTLLKYSAVVAALGALFAFAPMLGAALLAGTVGLFAMMKGFMAFSTVTVLFGKSFDAIGGIDEAVHITEQMGAFADAITSFAVSVMKFSALAALLGGMTLAAGLVGGILVGTGTAALMGLSTGLVAFGMVLKSFADKMGSTSEVEDTANKIVAIAKMFSVVPEIMNVLINSITPMVSKRMFGLMAAPAEKLNGEAIKKFSDFFIGVSKMMRDGIIDPVKENLADAGEIKDVTSKILGMAQIIDVIPGMMDNVVNGIIPIIEGSLFWSSPADKLTDTVMADFKKFFTKVGTFLRDGVVTPIRNNFADVAEVEKVSSIIVALGSMVSVIPKMMDDIVNGIIPILEGSGWWFSGPDLTDTVMADFKEFFTKVGTFLRDGVVTPIRNNFSDVAEVEKVSKIIVALGSMVSVIPKMMDDIVNGIIPIIEGSGYWFSSGPADKLTDTVMADFKEFFTKVGTFLRDGVVTPIRNNFADVDEVQKVSQIIVALGSMVSVIPKMMDDIINGIIPILKPGLFSDSPAEKLESKMWEFADFFEGVALFLRYGVISPIRNNFADESELKTVLGMMNTMSFLIANIPGFLESLSMSITGLVESKGWFGLGASPMQEIAAKVVTFSSYFQAIGVALGEGVVRPIRDYFPKPKQLNTALKQLDSMASLVAAIPDFLIRINSSIGTLVDGTWWKAFTQNPMGTMTKKIQLFSGYFQAIATALGEGIIDPIKDYWPKPKEIKTVGKQIDQMEKVIKKLPGFLESLDESVGDFFLGTWWKMSSLYNRTSVFADYFKSIAVSINDGLIQPIHKEWPKSKDIKEVGKRIDEVQKIVETLPSFLESLTTVVEEYVDGGWWENDKIAGLSSKVEVFAAYFENIAAALDDGLLKPIQKWPESSKIEEIGEKLSTVESVISELPSTLQLLTDSMQSLENGAWWDLQLDKEKQKYIDFFSSTGSFIVDSLINPVNLLPETSAIQESITRIELICEIFNKYAEAMSCMAEASKNLSSTEPIDLTGMENVGDAIKNAQPAISSMLEGAQVNETTLFPKDYRDPASLTQEELMMQKTGAQVNETTIAGTDESNESLKRLTTVSPENDPRLKSNAWHQRLLEQRNRPERVGPAAVESQSQQMLVNQTGMTPEQQLEKFGHARSGRKFESDPIDKQIRANQLATDKARRAAEGYSPARGGIQENLKVEENPFDKQYPTSKDWDKQYPTSKSWDEKYANRREIGAMAKGGDFLTTGAQLLLVGEKGAERISVKPADQVANLEKKAFEHSEMTSKSAASVLNVPSSVRAVNAQPKPLSDVHERVRQQYATEDEGSKNKSKDMAEIASASNSQVSLLEKLHEDNQQLLKAIEGKSQPGRSEGNSQASTKNNQKPLSSPKYGNWQYGKMGQNASRQILTPG